MNQINAVTIGKLIAAHREGDEEKFRNQKPPVGSRENPSNPKQEGTDAVFIPTTAKWMKK